MRLRIKMCAFLPFLMKSQENNVKLFESCTYQLVNQFLIKDDVNLMKSNFNSQNNSGQFNMENNGNTNIGSITHHYMLHCHEYYEMLHLSCI
ncbi:hypothetical protein QL285_072999 [Trifolium repens]|nr:hypothetical protein QL285_072999 [Trifolium repens]